MHTIHTPHTWSCTWWWWWREGNARRAVRTVARGVPTYPQCTTHVVCGGGAWWCVPWPQSTSAHVARGGVCAYVGVVRVRGGGGKARAMRTWCTPATTTRHVVGHMWCVVVSKRKSKHTTHKVSRDTQRKRVNRNAIEQVCDPTTPPRTNVLKNLCARLPRGHLRSGLGVALCKVYPYSLRTSSF